MSDPKSAYPQPPYPKQKQEPPGETEKMEPRPDHGEQSYVGSGKLSGKVALITGADSGIGRAVAIAFAREGADVLISYLSEDADAQETLRWVKDAGSKALAVAGDIGKRRTLPIAGPTGRGNLRSARHSRKQCRPSDHDRQPR